MILGSIIYKQSFEKPYIPYANLEIKEDGYSKIACIDCRKTGVYKLPNGDTQKCIECKGSGYIWISLF